MPSRLSNLRPSWTLLAEAYAFEPVLFDKKDGKSRFSNGHTFFDIWFGSKGVTLGIYHKQNGTMSYMRKVGVDTFEDMLMRLSKEQYTN